jgi:hypothetical protein
VLQVLTGPSHDGGGDGHAFEQAVRIPGGNA